MNFLFGLIALFSIGTPLLVGFLLMRHFGASKQIQQWYGLASLLAILFVFFQSANTYGPRIDTKGRAWGEYSPSVSEVQESGDFTGERAEDWRDTFAPDPNDVSDYKKK